MRSSRNRFLRAIHHRVRWHYSRLPSSRRVQWHKNVYTLTRSRSRRPIRTCARSVSRWAIAGSIYDCASSVGMSAVATIPRTSTPRGTFSTPFIHSSDRLSRGSGGSGAMWMRSCQPNLLCECVRVNKATIVARARREMAQRFGTFMLALWLSAMLVGCGGIAPSEQPAPTPGGMVVTVRVADAEEYRLRLTDPDNIDIAQKLLAGESAPRIPNGRVVRGDPDVNVGYSWHIDPDSVEFADTATEVCDGRPSDVEKRVITSDRYCPWSAKVVAIAPAQSHWSTEQHGARADARSLVQMRHPV